MNTPAWAKMPRETSKSFLAFQRYLSLPVHHDDPTKRRTIKNVADQLGYKASDPLEKWSAKFNWVARAQAYDEYIASKQIVAHEVGIGDAQRQVLAQLSLHLLASNEVIEKMIAHLHQEAEKGIINALDVLRMVQAIRAQDDLARRMVGLPTDYKIEKVEDDQPENPVFYIGGTS